MNEPNNVPDQSQHQDAAPDLVASDKEQEIVAATHGKTVEPDAKPTFLQSYLKRAGKLLIIFTLIGCAVLTFAAWFLISTFDRIISSIK